MKAPLFLAFMLGAASGSASTMYIREVPPVIIYQDPGEHVNPGAIAWKREQDRKARKH